MVCFLFVIYHRHLSFEALSYLANSFLCWHLKKTGWTPLIWASSEGHAEVVEVLIQYREKNCNLSLQDSRDGNTALHWAVYKGHEDIVQMLVTNGISVDTQNNRGETAFLLAAYYGHSSMVTVLMKADCDISIEDNDRETGLSLARKQNNQVTEMIIMRYSEYIGHKKQEGVENENDAENSSHSDHDDNDFDREEL